MTNEIPCEQPFEDGTHCQEPRGHHLTPIARAHLAQARAELAAARERAQGAAETTTTRGAERPEEESDQ